MQTETFTLTAFFIICISLLLYLLIYSKGYWWLKAPTIFACLFYSLVVWNTISSYLGWAAPIDTISPVFLVKYVTVYEPRDEDVSTGSIYILVQKMKSNKDPNKNIFDYMSYKGDDRNLRFHKLPYSRELHKQMNEVRKMLKKGKTVIGEYNKETGKLGTKSKGDKQGEGKGKGDGKGMGEGGKKGIGQGNEGAFGDGLGEFMFYELPPERLIPKNDQEDAPPEE